jgi:hypothetical protein
MAKYLKRIQPVLKKHFRNVWSSCVVPQITRIQIRNTDSNWLPVYLLFTTVINLMMWLAVLSKKSWTDRRWFLTVVCTRQNRHNLSLILDSVAVLLSALLINRWYLHGQSLPPLLYIHRCHHRLEYRKNLVLDCIKLFFMTKLKQERLTST